MYTCMTFICFSSNNSSKLEDIPPNQLKHWSWNRSIKRKHFKSIELVKHYDNHIWNQEKKKKYI